MLAEHKQRDNESDGCVRCIFEQRCLDDMARPECVRRLLILWKIGRIGVEMSACVRARCVHTFIYEFV